MARRLHAIFYWMLDATPVGLRIVIIVDELVIVAVPVPTGALVVLRRLFELVLGKVGPISAEFCIVLQERPRRGTQALNLSAGVSNCKVLRGRSFSVAGSRSGVRQWNL